MDSVSSDIQANAFVVLVYSQSSKLLIHVFETCSSSSLHAVNIHLCLQLKSSFIGFQWDVRIQDFFKERTLICSRPESSFFYFSWLRKTIQKELDISKAFFPQGNCLSFFFLHFKFILTSFLVNLLMQMSTIRSAKPKIIKIKTRILRVTVYMIKIY